MEHLLEVMKIVAGAKAGDLEKVTTYTERLAEKLRAAGQAHQANRLLRALQSDASLPLSVARLDRQVQVPLDTESNLPLADLYPPVPGKTRVILNKSAESRISRFLRYVSEAEKLSAGGVGVTPSLLMYGPPGCGKTELGRHIAEELQLPLYTARSDTLVSSYLGSTAKNIRALFESAAHQKCILFLDELDAFAKLRDDRHELGELKRVVISLIQNIDTLRQGTVLLGATNHEHLLDPAIWRRFSYKLHLKKPGREERVKILMTYLESSASQDDCEILAQASEGLTGAEIRQASEDARRDSILEGSTSINLASLLRQTVELSLSEHANGGMDTVEVCRHLNAIDAGQFSIRRMAEIFSIAKSTLARQIKQPEG